VRSEVEGKIAAVRSALQGGSIDQIRSAAEELARSAQRISQAVYGGGPQPGPGAAGPGPQGPGGPAEEGTVEGEYREV